MSDFDPDKEGPGIESEQMPLSREEIDQWLEGLAPSDTQRATRIKDLLRHAAEDGMSLSDRVICHSCLRRLETKHDLKRVK